MTRNDDNINFDDIPELTDAELSTAKVAKPIIDFKVTIIPEKPRKIQKTIRFDADMLAWFQENHTNYQTQMNNVLRHYYKAHKSDS